MTSWIFLAAGLLVLAGALLAAVRAAFWVVTVRYESMTPTLRDGDRLLVCRAWPAAWLRRGQIVVIFPGPRRFLTDAAGECDPFVKRVTALAGDEITTRLTDLVPHFQDRVRAHHDAAGLRTWRIPDGHFFVRGDHPVGGHDSLLWGPIPFQALLGVALCRLSAAGNRLMPSRS